MQARASSEPETPKLKRNNAFQFSEERLFLFTKPKNGVAELIKDEKPAVETSGSDSAPARDDATKVLQEIKGDGDGI